MGHLHFLLDEMGLDEMGLDEMGWHRWMGRVSYMKLKLEINQGILWKWFLPYLQYTWLVMVFKQSYNPWSTAINSHVTHSTYAFPFISIKVL